MCHISNAYCLCTCTPVCILTCIRSSTSTLLVVLVDVLVLVGDVRPVARVRGGRGSDLKHTVLHPRRLLPVRLARPAKGKNPTCSPHETLLENMVTDWQWHIDEIQKQ